MLPASLKDHVAQPHSPWSFSPEVISRLQNLSHRHQGAVLLPSDPEAQMVIKYFMTDKPPGYSVGKITAISNRILQTGFMAHLVTIEEEAKKFLPAWMNEPLRDQRKEAIATWEASTSSFSPLQVNIDGQLETLNHAKVLPLWHGTSLPKANSICESGLTYFGKHAYFTGQKGVDSTDIGYFGSGIYFTESAHYATCYSQGFLFLSWVSMRQPHAVVSDVPHPQQCSDMKSLAGKGAYQNYDAHFIPVAPIFPKNPHCMIYYPCFQDQPHRWHEIVVFQKAQTLPTYLIELEPDLLPSLNAPYSFAVLFAACQGGDLPRIKNWITEDRSRLDAENDQGETCYFAAVLGGHLDILQWLYVQNRQGIAKCRQDGWSLMHLAVVKGDEKIILWLNDKNPNMIVTGDPSPLQLSAYQELISVLNLFIQHKQSLHLNEILKRACPKTLQFLLNQGLDSNSTFALKQTLLHKAAESGQVEHLKLLTERGANINAQDLSQKTPLYYAVAQGHLEATLFLLQKGADPSVPGIEGDTILHVAAFYGYTPILKHLIQYPFLLSLKDKDGKQAIHKAVWMHPKPDIVELLLEAGADPNSQNAYGYTPLHWAAKHGHIESGKRLVDKGASFEMSNTNGDFPLDLAIRWGQDSFVAHFLNIKLPEELPHQRDIEGYCCTKLLQAKKQEKSQEQIFYLQKIAELYIQKQNWVQAAKLLNGAYALCQEGNLKKYFLAKLESVERLFLKTKDIKLLASQNYRGLIANIRTFYFNEFQEGQSAHTILPLLTASYKKMLGSLILNSQKILGPPPCEWTCIGMGSMARNEMCPYSDLEFAFLISENTDQNLSYFRLLSQFLEINIINFGETHFPIFAPLFEEEARQSLTPKGLSLDTGGNTPLGKPGLYELIGTPEEIARFQSSQWLKDDLIIASALSAVCYIAGDKRLLLNYNQAKTKQFEVTNSWIPFLGDPFHTQLAIELINGSLKEFKPDLSKHKQADKAFGIKKELYRPFQSVLSALALFAKIPSTSTLEIVSQLLNRNIFCPQGAKNLSRAFQSVLHLRLDAHIFYKHEGEFLLHMEEKPDPHYLYLDQKKIDILQEIYQILIPFYKCAEKFLQAFDLKVFAQALFYDEKPDIQGHAFEKALQYRMAQEAHQHAVSLNPHNIDAHLNLGSIEHKMAQYQEARQRYEEAIKLTRTNHGENHIDVALGYNNIGGILHDLGNHEEALEFFQKALQIKLVVLGDQHPSTATSYHNIGSVCEALGNYVQALEFYQNALPIRIYVLGDLHPTVATNYNNMGEIYRILGNYEKAFDFHQKALHIERQVFGERHPTVAMSYNNIAVGYKDIGNYGQALEFSQKALQIWVAVLGDLHPLVATSYNNRGEIYRVLGDHEKAREFYQKALEIRLQVFNDSHPEVATCYNNIGLVCTSLGNYEEAFEKHQKALEIRRQALGDLHLSVSQSYNNIGFNYYTQGNQEKALEFYQKALPIRLQVLGDIHPDVATVYSNMGSVYDVLNDYKNALQFFQGALKILVESYRQKHPNIQAVLAALIICAQQIPRAERTDLNETYAFCFKILGHSEPLLQQLLNLQR